MIPNRSTAGPPRRRAFTLIEVAVTSLLLVAGMSLTLHVVTWVASERRAVERRVCAIQEVANLMERLDTRPWDELTPQAVKGLSLSEPAQRLLPEPELTVAIADEDAPIASKRVSIRLRWQVRAGTWGAPVRLTSWVVREEARP